ncbi:hypothetical protein FOPG_19906, partial [Fusarium oxysporum f. sp. conglutinans race 2 54008]
MSSGPSSLIYWVTPATGLKVLISFAEEVLQVLLH